MLLEQPLKIKELFEALSLSDAQNQKIKEAEQKIQQLQLQSQNQIQVLTAEYQAFK